jgi:hypothetical protein
VPPCPAYFWDRVSCYFCLGSLELWSFYLHLLIGGLHVRANALSHFFYVSIITHKTNTQYTKVWMTDRHAFQEQEQVLKEDSWLQGDCQ